MADLQEQLANGSFAVPVVIKAPVPLPVECNIQVTQADYTYLLFNTKGTGLEIGPNEFKSNRKLEAGDNVLIETIDNTDGTRTYRFAPILWCFVTANKNYTGLVVDDKNVNKFENMGTADFRV